MRWERLTNSPRSDLHRGIEMTIILQTQVGLFGDDSASAIGLISQFTTQTVLP